MTTSRVIRGTRAKVSLYICGILVITGLIACYNSTLSQLDDVRKSSDNCRQHEEHLSAQLQVISEYKQRLENSLKTEKAEHQQTKTSFENKLNEEKAKYEKNQRDNKLNLSSLQQHFNLLQTEYDDFKEECSKNQQKQHEEINTLDAKLKEVREELKKVQASKETLKSQYLDLQSKNEMLEKKLKETEGYDKDQESNVNHLTKERNELRREVDRLKLTCNSQDVLQEPKISPSDQVSPKNLPNQMSQVSSLGLMAQKPSESNLLINVPPPVQDSNQRVLDKPNNSNKLSSSTSTARSELKSSQANLGNIRPLLLPTVTPETIKKGKRKLPEGVVAVPETKGEEQQQQAPGGGEIMNNRYRNVKESANDLNNERSVKEEMDKENGAHEEFDVPAAQNGFEGLGFDQNDRGKLGEGHNFEKKHIDHLGMVQDKKSYDQDQEYRDLHDVQLEENEEDDDIDGYEDHMARHKDPAVRN